MIPTDCGPDAVARAEADHRDIAQEQPEHRNATCLGKAKATMRLFALAIGALIADSQRREGTKGPFATATISRRHRREAILVSVIALVDEAERLLEYVKCNDIAVVLLCRRHAGGGP